MKTQHPFAILFSIFSCLTLPGLVSPAGAATMTNSATAPAVNGLDIANYGTITGNDKWFAENSGDGSAKGQTFTTGAIPSLLKSVTYQVTSSQKAEPTKNYTIRVGTVSGTTFTQVHSETATQTFTWNGGEYMTWTFATPVPLNPNTLYGVDVGMTSSTSSWQTGIPYINVTGNVYTGGQFYDSGTNGVGTNTITITSGSDRIFHLGLQHPLNPSPDIGATVPAGDLTLSWTNLAPNTGSDVWVDVWFGTDPGALTKVADKQQNLSSFPVNLPGANTYYWRVDSYLDGAPTGTPVQSTEFNFIVTDSDSDGFPDTYELAHTTPPSAKALNVGDDLEPDGLTNWQEYQLGTIPTNPDTDSDTLNDGPELTGVGSRPPTDPTKADTDGDGLNDGVESNTGTWISATNTGTNPAKADTDSDALSDGVETNTGTYASKTNTGTHPLASDTDADGAGDWYEVTASFTSPFLATEKPDIPYPLPDPDASTGAANKPVKVYIMSGQSNMVGFGTRDGTGDNSLQTMTLRENKFPDLVNGTGGWTTRQDVRYRGVISDTGKVQLSPANLGTTFGPELGFGYIMGWHHDEPVLLLKTSIGNRSLGWDVYPAGSPSYEYGGSVYASYGQSPLKWTVGGAPSPFQWYAGKQYDDYFLHESNMGPLTAWTSGTAYPDGTQLRHNGVLYVSKDRPNPIVNHTASPESEPGIGADWQTYWQVYSIFNAVDVLDNFATEYPDWAAQGFEIAGFVWWQGDKDRYDLGHATRYEQNLVNLITSLRSYYTNRYPGKVVNNAPFVLATLGQTPLTSTDPAEKPILDGMLAVDGESGDYPQFAGNVKTVYAHPLSEGGASNGHYNGRAGTYMLVGDALGRAMVELEAGATPTGFAAWQAANTATGQTPADDHDGDGVPNGIEWFVMGSDNSTGFTALPNVDKAPGTGALSITWTKNAAFPGTYGTDFVVETSETLTGTWTAETSPGTVTLTGNQVIYTFPTPLGGKKFARIRVVVATP
jgi:alpha-galactosidase